MAVVLSHAGVSPNPPTKASLANLKVPGASVPAKPGAHAEGLGSPASKFQALLDRAFGPKPAAETNTVEKPKAPKAKAAEHAAEKPKEPKKTEAKEPRPEAGDLSALAVLHGQNQAKAEPAVKGAKALETEAAGLAAEKAKAPRGDRKAGPDAPAPVTAAAAEVARSQAQQNAPRAERSEDKQKVFVVDRRSDKEKEKAKTAETAAAAQPVNAAVEVQTQAKPVDQKAAASEVQVSFQTVSGKGRDGFDLKAQQTPPSPRDAVTFQQYLVERGYGQMVDQARIVLKDQNAGEIRMTLYPESLGKVKVSLDLSDNTLAGQIFVENQTVKEVFQSNMDGLLQAFQDGGWNDVSLQVSVGQEGGAGNGNPQPQTAPQARDYGRQVAQTGTVEGRSDRIGSWNDRQINLTA